MKKLLTFIAVLTAMCLLVITASAAAIGDVDGNGRVTAADARFALRIAAKLNDATQEQMTAADTNADGMVTAIDARKILRVAAALEKFEGLPGDEKPSVGESETTTEPVLGEGKIIKCEDLVQMSAEEIAQKYTVKQDEVIRNKYFCETFWFTKEGSASKTPEKMASFECYGREFTCLGLRVGMKLNAAVSIIEKQYEYALIDHGEYSVLSLKMGEFDVDFKFSDDALISISGTGNEIDYDISAYIGKSVDKAFDASKTTIWCGSEDEYGEIGFRFENLYGHTAVHNGENCIYKISVMPDCDFHYKGIYVGDSGSKLRDYIKSENASYSEVSGDYYIFCDDYQVVFTINYKNEIVNIKIESRDFYGFRYISVCDYMDTEIERITPVAGPLPVNFDFGKNIWVFDDILVKTQGAAGSMPYNICGIAVFEPGYYIDTVECGMSIEDALEVFSDSEYRNITYDKNEGVIYGLIRGYDFRVYVENGIVAWYEIFNKEWNYSYDLLDVITYDFTTEAFFENFDVVTTKDSIVLALDSVSIHYMTDGNYAFFSKAVITQDCDFSLCGLYVDDSLDIAEKQLRSLGFEWTEDSRACTATKDNVRITVTHYSDTITQLQIEAVE